MSARSVTLLFCLLVVYLTLFYKLGSFAFLGADEPRYARIAEEMNLRGEYVTPTLNFRPWLEKPPLLFWLSALSYKLFGVDEWTARLPVALLGGATVFLAGFLASRLSGSRAGILAALILTTSGLFVVFARAASTDVPVVAMLTASLVCGFLATLRSTLAWAAAAGAALALAVLAKGPVALILFGGIFLLYFLVCQKYLWTWSQTAVGLLVFSALSVPWFWKVWVENGYNFVMTFWLNHHLARFITGLHHHSQPVWYYVAVIFLGFFPWIFFLGSSFVRAWRRGRRLIDPPHQAELFLCLWIAFPLLFFSISASKLAGYILPVFPALAVLAGLEWERYISGDVTAYRMMKGQLIGLTILGALVTAALIAGFHFVYHSWVLGLLLGAPLAAGIFQTWREFRRRRAAAAFFVLVAAMTLFAALLYWKAAPVLDDFHSARDLSLEAGLRVSRQKPLVLYRYFHHTAGYYTDYETTDESIPDLPKLRKYLSSHPQDRYYILTQEAGWNDLQASLNPRLIKHQGNLYLVEIATPTGQSASK